MNVMLAVWARDRRHVEPENYLALSVLDDTIQLSTPYTCSEQSNWRPDGKLHGAQREGRGKTPPPPPPPPNPSLIPDQEM